MNIEIKNRWTGNIIIAREYESVKDALQKNRDADLRDADLRDADLMCADLMCADLGGADLGGADLRDADLRDADLMCADLGGADLRGADLGGAYLMSADLRGADLGDADLRGADLRGADLRGANGIILPIITISGTKHTFFYMSDIIQIGCEKWAVDHWLEHYQTIGEKNDYTPEEIAEYKTYIDMIANLKKTGKISVKVNKNEN